VDNAAGAFRYGFHAPEHLLTCYNHGNHGPWDLDIELEWIPGENDPYRKPLVATVGAHMAEIARERASLGLPPLLAHEIPVRDTELGIIALHILPKCEDHRYLESKRMLGFC
jgi:hypothetical protein